ncbi:MAG: hypothetical protein H0W11_15655 [Gemmatimonadetes bacterium]|nr:hypothetical protein [Gemmatimonadota bacterium]
MLRFLTIVLFLLFALPAAGAAQALLVPSTRAPYSAKFDLQLPDAQYFFQPQTPLERAEGPYRFRFRHSALNELLDHPATVSYLTAREGGFHLQLFHIRATALPAEALGPQEFEVQAASGEAVGRGTLLVVTRAPEPVDLLGEDLTRIFEAGRTAPVRLVLRTHGNFSGELRVVNARDFELSALREEPEAASGTMVLHGELRPLRAGASELRVSVGTADGRDVELAFPGLTVRDPEPYRVTISGGPLYLGTLGRGSAPVVIEGFPEGLASAPTVVAEREGELTAVRQRFDRASGELSATLEFSARTPRQPGSRELREVVVRAGPQLFTGHLEVVGAPVVSAVRAEQQERAALAIGGPATVLRIAGQNLDGLRLDCAPLGADARCEPLGSSPNELVERVTAGAGLREGEVLLPLIPVGRRAESVARPHGLTVRVAVERPAIPTLLTRPGLLEVNCQALRSCRMARGGESMVVGAEDAQRLQLLLRESQLPAEHGWQRLVVSVIRVRGEQRQTVRTLGSPAAPRTYRQGLPTDPISLLDAGTDARHGDQFIVRVEHAAEQYAAEHRTGAAASEGFVRRVYVDGGLAKRITGDIAVQPVLFRFGGGEEGGVTPLYPNAGLGVTWQPLNERLEPRLFAAKLQLLAADIKSVGPGGRSMQPALFLSGNLRIPGTDPARPLVLALGAARMWGDEPGWRMLAGAGMDIGVARLIFGG